MILTYRFIFPLEAKNMTHAFCTFLRKECSSACKKLFYKGSVWLKGKSLC